MSMHMNFRKLAGTAVAAATLLAGVPASIATAADAQIAVPTDGTETITIKGSAATLAGHTFSALRIGSYDAASGDASQNLISTVSVGTVSDVQAVAETALSAVKTAAGVSTDPATGFMNNPVGEVAAHYLGYAASENDDNTDSKSNSEPDAYNGSLREFVTNLFDDSDFKTAVEGGTASEAVVDGADSTTINNLVPGIYVVEDTTAQSQGSSVGPKNSIPMLVSTGIHVGADSYNMMNVNGTTMGLAEINLKADTPAVKKTLDTDNGTTNNAGVGGEMHYKLTSSVPLTTGYKRYIFTMLDTPADASGKPSPGLALDETSVKITIGSKTLDSTDYKLTNTPYGDTETGVKFPGESDTHFVAFDLSPVITSYKYKDPITITYTMKVTDNAPSTGFSNGAHLAYSNDSNHQPAPSDPNNPDSPAVASVTGDGTVSDGTDNGTVTNTNPDNSSKVISYQRSFNLQVVNKTDEDQHLAGAQFQVKDSTGVAIKFIKVADGSYKKAADQSAISADGAAGSSSDEGGQAGDQALTKDAADRTDTLTVSDDGALKVDGLEDTSYSVYQTLEGTGFSHSFLPKFVVKLSGTGDNGKDSMVTNTADALWGLVDAQKTAVSADAAIIVRNVKSVSQLPLTGGAGIILFVVLALLLTGVAGCLYMLKRRNAQVLQNAAATR